MAAVSSGWPCERHHCTQHATVCIFGSALSTLWRVPSLAGTRRAASQAGSSPLGNVRSVAPHATMHCLRSSRIEAAASLERTEPDHWMRWMTQTAELARRSGAAQHRLAGGVAVRLRRGAGRDGASRTPSRLQRSIQAQRCVRQGRSKLGHRLWYGRCSGTPCDLKLEKKERIHLWS